MRIGLFLAALLAGAGAGAASAQAPESNQDREFRSIWLIQPSEEATGPRTVQDGGFVIRQRLLPPSLIRLDADASDQRSGRVIAPAGTQLFGLLTRGPPIYCVVGRRDASTLQRMLLWGGNRQICFADLDRDGRLDVQFNVGNQVRGVPNIAGRRPRNPGAVAGGGYTSLRPDQIETEYFVGLTFEGFIGLRNHEPVFRITFGNALSRESLSGDVRAVRNSRPWLVTALGAEVVVTEVPGRAIEADVRRFIPPQPFGVIRTVTYY